jgi:tRNA-2-methylthio-N6-dimethylallyladenosine synthase
MSVGLDIQGDVAEAVAQAAPSNAPRRFAIRTYGCQMNVHDSEKLTNLLLHEGYTPVADEEQADLLVINTCSIREKAENQLYSDLGKLREWKARQPGRILGVGGCVAQQEGQTVLRRFNHLDFLFGTHNLRVVPAMLRAAAQGERLSQTEETRSLKRFDFPERHPAYTGLQPARAYLTVMEGCDMFCSYCIVPKTRGREISRPAESILAEARQLAEKGIEELILLGQTVNAYGRHDLKRGRWESVGTMSFAALLRKLAEIPGIHQLRYTSPHPLFFDEELIGAHRDIEALCPHVHLPLQSGSDAVLESMKRRYSAQDFLEIVANLRRVRPDINISTDVIVGFPGEQEDDFDATLEVMREAAFVDSFSFKYSERPDTTALGLPGAVPPHVMQERLERLQDVQRELTLRAHGERIGGETLVRLEGESRKGQGQWRGRDPYHRVVNLDIPANSEIYVPGTRVAVQIVDATPHSLIGELKDRLNTGYLAGTLAQELLTIV